MSKSLFPNYLFNYSSIHLFISLSIHLFIYSSVFAEPGTTALNFLKIPAGVKGVGMGEAFTAVSDDASCFYWNPAGLSQIKYSGLNVAYTEWFQDIKYQTLSFVQPSKLGNISLSLYNLSFGDIDGYTNTGAPSDEVDAHNRALIVSYGKEFQKGISAGLNLKIIQEQLDNESLNTYAFDFGLLYRRINPAATFFPLSLGFSLQNIGPKIKYVNEKDDLPFNIKTGVGYKLFHNDLTLAADYNIPKDNLGYFNIGLEYQFLDLLKIRTGYKFRDIEGIRCGFGIGNEEINFDYAFVPYGILGDTHRFGMNFYFGKSRRLDTVQSRIEKHLKKGRRYFSEADLIQSQREFKSVLIYDPVNSESETYLNKIKARIDEVNVEKYLISGKRHLEGNELLKAKDEFENILALIPGNAQAKSYLIEVDNKILEENKRRLEVLFAHGMEFYKRDEYEDAIDIWQKVLLLDKNHTASKEYISIAKSNINEREKIKDVERLKILYQTAEELYLKGTYKKALDLFTETDKKSKGYLQTEMYLIKTREKVAEMYFREGLKLYENGFYKEAVNVFEKSLRYNSYYKEPLEYMSKCKEKIAEEKEKLKVLSDEYNRKGLIEYNQGNLKEAIRFFEKALESNPEHETAVKNIERARKELKK